MFTFGLDLNRGDHKRITDDKTRGRPGSSTEPFSSEGNSFLKHSSESSSTLNGQLCLTSALKLPRKYIFLHSFHVIVFRRAGEKAEGRGGGGEGKGTKLRE